MNDLALLLHLFGNSEETKLLICTVIFCLHQRNGGLNSGQKSANIVTEVLMLNAYTMLHALQNLWKSTKLCENYCQAQCFQAVLSGGSSPLRPYRNTTSMAERVQYPKCAYDLYHICIGLGSEAARNGQYKRLTEKMRVMSRKTKVLTPLNFIPVHKNTYFEIKSVAKSLV